ncbi:MAG TPA: hypothetical protein VEN79_12805 [Terriglobia bacterium]|nr:hypothetical protein [Terriglobia bacterium]
MFNKLLVLFVLIGQLGFGQNVPHPPSATPQPADELLARAKTIYVVSHSFYVKKEQLEASLIHSKDLAAKGIQVVESERDADLVLKVGRAPFQNNFPFTFTDRRSGIVVMGGTVNSFFGTVSGRIAGRLEDKLKDVRRKSNP